MAPTEKKWNDAAERDVLMAMLCANSSGGSIKTNWAAVVKSMTEMGYDFSESAITQKFQKSMLREFRKRHGQDCVARFSSGASGGSGEVSTPRKRTTAAADGSASASKRKKTNLFTPINTPSKGCKLAAADDEFDDDLGIKEEMDMDTPVKKLKLEVDASLTSPVEHPNDAPVGFEQWMKECET